MKLKKLLLLPIGLLALASCTNSQLTKEVANAKLVEAAEKMMTTSMTSVDLNLDASLELVVTQFEEVVTDPFFVGTIDADLSVKAKAKNLDKATAEFAVTAEGSLVMTEDNFTTVDVGGNIGAYYVDEFAYLNYGLTLTDGETNTKQSVSSKQKMAAGPFPGLPTDEIMTEDLDLSEITAMLNEIRNVKATDKGGVIVITYKLTQQDVIDMYTENMIKLYTSIMGHEPTSEEEAAIRAEAETYVNEMVTIRKAEVVIEINKAGFISKLDVLLDADLYSVSGTYDYETESYVYFNVKTSVKADVNFSLKINEPVTITYPSFAEYLLVDDFVLPEMGV